MNLARCRRLAQLGPGQPFLVIRSIIHRAISATPSPSSAIVPRRPGVYARLGLIGGYPAHGPGMMLGIVPLVGAGGDE